MIRELCQKIVDWFPGIPQCGAGDTVENQDMVYHVWVRQSYGLKWDFLSSFNSSSEVMKGMKLIRECYPTFSMQVRRSKVVSYDEELTA